MTFQPAGAGARLRRGVAGVLLLTQVAACTKMQTLERPGPYVESRRPVRLWVTLANGPEMVIESPRVIADTVFGFNIAGAPVTLPLADLETVRARELNIGPTIGLGLLGLAVLVGVATLVTGGIDRNNGMTEETEDAVVPIF
jgi:hypothetical protein